MKDTLPVAKYELKSFAEIQYGFTAKANADPVGPKFLRITDLQDGKVDWNSVPFCEADDREIKKFRLSPGEIVFARTGATTGKSHLINDEVDAVFASYLIRVKPTGGRALPDYLAYYFQTAEYWEHITAGTEGAAQGGFNASKLGRLEIPLPPMEEQNRIVAVLDQAFAALDRARAAAETNLADAEALFGISLDVLLEKAGRNGKAELLGNICSLENGDRGKNYPGRKAFVSTGVPFINAGHIENGVISWDEMNFISEDHFDLLSKGKIKKDDILFCLRGSLGKFGKVDKDLKGAIASSLVIVRVSDRVLPDYLSIYFMSKFCRKMISTYAGGAAQPNLSAADLRKFKITVPEIYYQRAAIVEFERLWQFRQDLIIGFARKLSDLAALRQSLLHRAFSGQL